MASSIKAPIHDYLISLAESIKGVDAHLTTIQKAGHPRHHLPELNFELKLQTTVDQQTSPNNNTHKIGGTHFLHFVPPDGTSGGTAEHSVIKGRFVAVPQKSSPPVIHTSVQRLSHGNWKITALVQSSDGQPLTAAGAVTFSIDYEMGKQLQAQFGQSSFGWDGEKQTPIITISQLNVPTTNTGEYAKWEATLDMTNANVPEGTQVPVSVEAQGYSKKVFLEKRETPREMVERMLPSPTPSSVLQVVTALKSNFSQLTAKEVVILLMFKGISLNELEYALQQEFSVSDAAFLNIISSSKVRDNAFN